MKKHTIFISRQIPEFALKILYQAPNLIIDAWDNSLPPPPHILRQQLPGKDGLFCTITEQINAELLDHSGSQLKVISQMAVGVDNIDVAACTQHGIPVGHTPGVLTEATADLTMALLLATARQLMPAFTAVKTGQWQTWQPMGFTGPDVHSSTVGIIGLGRIGMAVAHRLQGFGVRLLYHNRQPREDAGIVNAQYSSLDDLLAESDFVILLTALTPETHHLINAARLRQMKATATLINVSRGGVVDQDALLVALQDGVIAYAGLDVTTPEPMPASHPLLQLPNVTVLPHIGSAGIQARTMMAQLAAQNLLAGLHGERMPYCVNPEVYTGIGN